MQIYPVNHAKNDKNRYCGPSALSIVTGMATGEAARLLRHVTGKPSIKGASTGAMRKSYERCGIIMRSIYKAPPIITVGVPRAAPGMIVRAVYGKRIDKRPTLAAWFRESVALRSAGRVFLISAGHHWQIVSGRRFVCGQTKAIVGFDHKLVHRRARVDEVFELLGDKIITPPEAKKASGRPAPGGRAIFNDLCRKHRLDWGYEGSQKDPEYIDIMATTVWPEGLSFCFWDWEDACRIVEEAVADPTTVSEEGWVSH